MHTATNNKQPLEEIAIIGMSCIFPQAPDLVTFWNNILSGVDAVSEPPEAWDAPRYEENGRITTRFGGFLKELYRFDGARFGIMPSSVDGAEPDQFLALAVAADALRDAGYLGDGVDHQATGIVLGHSTYMHRGQVNYIQHHIVLDQTIDLMRQLQPSMTEAQLTRLRSVLEQQLASKAADIAPGLVPNVMTGRIANRLNLKGPNYILDAACSSSLLSVSAAIDELRSGRSNMMLAGGVNATMPAEVFIMFTQLGALSGSKVRPFSRGSDGTLLGEGLGVVCLKRLSDAVRDQDRVYAVIKGIGQSSDGKGRGLLAPSEEGETLAMRRAYDGSGVDPATVSLIEAHGTGIPLGDQTEIAALRTIFGERRQPFASVAVGSVKSMISHCIPAAGIAGLIKTALALHHKVLPPTLCDEINPQLGLDRTPFYINTETRPWLAPPGTARRAGVSSFGFGGINAHAVLEESPRDCLRKPDIAARRTELCVFSGATIKELAGQLERVRDYLDHYPAASLGDVAWSLASHAHGERRAGVVAKNGADLARKIDKLLDAIHSQPDKAINRNGIVYVSQPTEGKVAFLFPGEGSQYLSMLAELALHFDEVREWLEFWGSLYGDAPGALRTDYALPPPSDLNDERRELVERRIHTMDVGSEAVFIGGQAVHALVRSLGLEADVMLGHSSGESTALACSGALGDSGDREQLGRFIRQLNEVYREVIDAGEIPRGRLLAVGALSLERVEAAMARVDEEVHLAMDNCKNQVVLYGSVEAIDRLAELLGGEGGICALLPFDRGYHTPRFAAMAARFREYYRSIGLRAPKVPLYSCATVDLFPNDAAAVCEVAASQWALRVRFREVIDKMYADGVRFFVEIGPSANLTGFLGDILAKRESVCVATNARKKSDLEQLQLAMANLFAHRKLHTVDRLFVGRAVNRIDFAERGGAARGAPVIANTMPMLRVTDEIRALAAEMAEAKWPRKDPAPLASSLPLARPEGAADSAPPAVEPIIHIGEVAMPFLSEVVAFDGSSITAECYMDVRDDRFLQDHVLSGCVSEVDPELYGLSCVPLMVSVEIMAEACAMLSSSVRVVAIENIRAHDWLTVEEGALLLTVTAECVDASKGIYRAAIQHDDRMIVDADFHFSESLQHDSLPPLADAVAFRWAPEEFYTTGMFHGSTFQSIHSVRGWSRQGMDAELGPCTLRGFFAEDELAELVLNPVLLDALGQLVAFWHAQDQGTDFNSFPSAIRRIDLSDLHAFDLQGAVLRGRRRAGADGAPAGRNQEWDFECLDASGNIVLHATGWKNVLFDVPHRFYEVRHQPLAGWLGAPHVDSDEQDALIWRLDYFDESFCAVSGGIFLKILAYTLLDREEREEWLALQGPIRHRREWLLGRACIKEAVRYWIYRQTDYPLYPSDIHVHHDSQGAPYVTGWWEESVIEAPGISLCHDTERAMAAVVAGGSHVGIDAESLSRDIDGEKVAKSFGSHERRYLAATDGAARKERLLRMWCAREAAAKYLGVGLQGDPAAFSISFDAGSWDFATVGFEQYAVPVSLRRDGAIVVAVASEILEARYAVH